MFHLHPSHVFFFFFFDIWNTFEHVLRYFVIDNNYKLLITFQRADVYLMNQSKLMN